MLRSTLVPLVAATLAVACRHPAPEPGEAVRESQSPSVSAVSALPVDLRARFDEALALRKSGDEAGARRRLDEVLAAAPGFTLASLERAELLVASGEAAAARADGERAFDALPQNPRASRVLGQIREELEDVDGALVAYEHSLQVRDDPALRRRVAGLTARAGRLDAAARLWEAVRDADPDEPGARLELATLYEKLDRPASCEAEYRALVAAAPANAVFRRKLAEFLERIGKTREARAERAKLETPKNPVDSRKLRPLPPASR